MLDALPIMADGRFLDDVVRAALADGPYPARAPDRNIADLTRFDCQPLPGLLAERLLAHSPHLERVFFGNRAYLMWSKVPRSTRFSMLAGVVSNASPLATVSRPL